MFQQVSLSAVAFSNWIPVDYRQYPPNVGVNVEVPSTVTGTYNVEFTTDPLLGVGNRFMLFDAQIPTSITRAATVATVVLPNHGLDTDDAIIVRSSNFPPGNGQTTALDGYFAVASVVDLNTFTYTVANSGITTASQFVEIIPTRVVIGSSMSALTTSFSGNFGFPIRAVRLNVTAYAGTGAITLQVTQGVTG